MKKLLLAIFAFLISQTAFSGWFDEIEYIKILKSKLNETKMLMTPSELKLGWTVIHKKTNNDTIKGIIFDPKENIRITYIASCGRSKEFLSARIISKDISLALKRLSNINLDEDDEAEAEAEAYHTKARIYLESIMGDYVFDRFYKRLRRLLYKKGAAEGYTFRLEVDVTTVKEWFDSNKEVALSFLNDFKDADVVKEFSQFLEMFVYDSADLCLVKTLCKEQEIIFSNSSPTELKEVNIYNLWKERKAVH